jgi:ribosomal protein L22
MSESDRTPEEETPVSSSPQARSEETGASSSAPETEITPTSDDLVAEEATEVVLEADDVAEGESGEAPAPVAAETAVTPEEEIAAAPAPAEVATTEAPAPPRQVVQPQRRRRRERTGAAAPVVRAQAKYVRSSARKARLVCDNIRGKTVEEARAILAHTPRAVARDWSKLLESAVANAEHNHSLDGEDLRIKEVHADEGPTIKRFRPRAMGRATKIRKRTTHLTILLTPKD